MSLLIQPSGIPILSPVLLYMLAISIFLLFKFEDFLSTCLASFFSFIHAVRIYYPKPALLSLLHTYCSITMRFVTKKIIWPVLSMYTHAFIEHH